MDRDDRRRYFVVGSVILEIVTPLFRQRLENDYTRKGIGSLQGFLNTQPVIHILFHLRHKNTRCCKDNANCTNRSSLPLNYSQWDLLYTETNPGINRHYCHCKFTAKPVQADELDITLASLILFNCCNIGPADEKAISELRKFKNNYLSHNSKGGITEIEYNSLWTDLTTYILQLDNSKQDDLIRIQRRPLDERVCEEYIRQLLDFYQMLEEMNVTILDNNTIIRGVDTLVRRMDASVRRMDTSVRRMDTSVRRMDTSVRRMDTSLQGTNADVKESKELLQKVVTLQDSRENSTIRGQSSHDRPYKIGQSIFYPHQQTDLSTVFSDECRGLILDGVMMDDGRLVLCLWNMERLLICNTDVSEVDSIQLQYEPWRVTSVNNSTVAVTLLDKECIEMYDINNKHKLKSIQVPGMWWLSGITTINNKLVVGGKNCLYIIDHQTGEKIQTIDIGDCYPCYLHTSGDRIFYCEYPDNKLYCYNYTTNKVTTKSLPSEPYRITSLQDGSLYVRCEDGSVQHVSSDGQHYKPVTTEGLTSLKDCGVISYNTKQRKLFTCTKTVNMYREK